MCVLVKQHGTMATWKMTFFWGGKCGRSTINGPCSIAMLNCWRTHQWSSSEWWNLPGEVGPENISYTMGAVVNFTRKAVWCITVIRNHPTVSFGVWFIVLFRYICFLSLRMCLGSLFWHCLLCICRILELEHIVLHWALGSPHYIDI